MNIFVFMFLIIYNTYIHTYIYVSTFEFKAGSGYRSLYK